MKTKGLINTIKKGKKLLDAHGDEVVTVLKKVTTKKRKQKEQTDTTSGMVEVEETAWVESGKELVENSVGLLSSLTEDNETIDGTHETTEVAVETISDESKEDSFFEDRLDTLFGTVTSTNPTNSQEVMAALATLSHVSNETIRYVEEQETRREEIRAERDVAIARINAISDSIKLYLEKTFDERSAAFAKLFDSLDVAMHKGNTEMLAMTINGINSLAASSPFKNLADIGQVQQALSAGDTEWDI